MTEKAVNQLLGRAVVSDVFRTKLTARQMTSEDIAAIASNLDLQDVVAIAKALDTSDFPAFSASINEYIKDHYSVTPPAR